MSGKTFSDSWYRIAGQRVGLRSTVEIYKQIFRGESWYVLHDRLNNQFFRIRPEARTFVGRLRPDCTVEEVWLETLEHHPDDAPGQEDVLRLLAQLHQANLLFFSGQADHERIFERYRKRKSKEFRAKLLGIMFMRIPLLDPDRALNSLRGLARAVYSLPGAMVWCFIMAWALKVFLDSYEQAVSQFAGILAPGNLVLLYLALIVIKVVHEFGHALACKRYGGEVHTLGVMFLILTPLPYIDVTSSWSFRNPRHRALVGAAGMMAEMLLASVAVFVWAGAGGDTVKGLAYNIMFIASVSTVLFNGNPLLRFDGYYILSDLLDIPNLHARATEQLRYWLEKYAFGLRDLFSPSRSGREAGMLGTFGVLSLVYKVVVFTAIIFFIADNLFAVGLILACLCGAIWVGLPIFKSGRYLLFDGRLARNRKRVLWVSFGFLAGLILLLGVVPFPHALEADGVVESSTYLRVYSSVPGRMVDPVAEPGSTVDIGTPLIRFESPELDLEIETAEAQIRETRALQTWAVRNSAADLEPIARRLASVTARLDDLRSRREKLLLSAEVPGVWVPGDLEPLRSAWLERGTLLGDIVDLDDFRFVAVVRQSEVADLFSDRFQGARVRIRGQAGEDLEVSDFSIIPFEQQVLPSAALGWRGGGDVPTSMSDTYGLKTREPYFQILADLEPASEVELLHGRSGVLRLELPAEPLMTRWIRGFRQMIQRRYKL